MLIDINITSMASSTLYVDRRSKISALSADQSPLSVRSEIALSVHSEVTMISVHSLVIANFDDTGRCPLDAHHQWALGAHSVSGVLGVHWEDGH